MRPYEAAYRMASLITSLSCTNVKIEAQIRRWCLVLTAFHAWWWSGEEHVCANGRATASMMETPRLEHSCCSLGLSTVSYSINTCGPWCDARCFVHSSEWGCFRQTCWQTRIELMNSWAPLLLSMLWQVVTRFLLHAVATVSASNHTQETTQSAEWCFIYI